MFKKMFKSSILIGLGIFLVAVLLFGPATGNFFRSTFKHVRNEVNDRIPIEFELERAKNMLEEIIPEMSANIQLISQEEVEIAALKSEIESNVKPLAMERNQIESLSGQMNLEKVAYSVGGHKFTRQELAEDLANRFERYKECEMLQQSRIKMLETRQKALESAIKTLANTKQNKQLLENKIASLESQYRLIQASQVGTGYSIDNSSMAKTEKMIDQIKKRLDVAERVLANKGKYLDKPSVVTVESAVNETELLSQIQDYFGPETSESLELANTDSELENAVATPIKQLH